MKRRLLTLFAVLVMIGALAGTVYAGSFVITHTKLDDRIIATDFMSEDDEGRFIHIDLTHVEGPSEDSY